MSGPYLATLEDLDDIVALLDARAAWLRARRIEQWPDRISRDSIAQTIASGETFVVRDQETVTATVTLDSYMDPDFWKQDEHAEQAVYLSKLAARPEYRGLGARLLTWCAVTAHLRGYRWLRLDAAKTNLALRRFYQRQGFRHLRTVDLPHRRSGALFARDVSTLRICG
jgi:ribosomal protein S18 acetylase RimI-like enzyme